MDRQKVSSILLKGLVAIAVAAVPAAISGYFSYRSASAEASVAKVKAELAYSTLVESVNKLQEQAEKQDLLSAKNEGRLDVIERICTQKSVIGMAPVHLPHALGPIPLSVVDPDGISDNPERYSQKRLPPRLDMLPAKK